MAIGVVNNSGSINAQNNLSRAQNSLNRSIERLSSGLKVNRGSDGPAALVISEKQRAQISGLKTAIDNADKAVSVVQTAEGALGEINSLLVKVRGLALDSANTGVNDEDALAANQAEIANALDTINRIANNTQFGTKKLLDGSAGKTGVAADADVTFLKAGNASSAGTYAVNVTQTAERAVADMPGSEATTVSPVTPISVTPTSVPPTIPPTGERGEPFSSSLPSGAKLSEQSTQTYTVPDGSTLLITQYIVQNPYGDEGSATLRLGDIPLEYDLANLDGFDANQGFVDPVQLNGGDTITFEVTCGAIGRAGAETCSPSATVIGRLIATDDVGV